eukprot:CAMPEP_0174380382 /NCGR_PEP_ID=MMETSP0811_2-20130205/123341_1 /TAXON_ID=73025 ORGANISM="Eutreptiella gymnastica-like, Strain CCMP1594" /NCGR_SAMPLE_ID=MMETSP0811_2 /ASSEMBLY_ACC=CAM_ASM_000667 /LENGTH=89 /DNA_ID=CAMNT_0015533235 /DNA_START=181 /DNA_END=450 /DNA_ORIENTATION=+
MLPGSSILGMVGLPTQVAASKGFTLAPTRPCKRMPKETGTEPPDLLLACTCKSPNQWLAPGTGNRRSPREPGRMETQQDASENGVRPTR